MNHVDDMISDILRKAGGYVDHRHDRGGPTKFGITQRTLSAYLGRTVSVREIHDLPESMAGDIYAHNYYFKPKIDRLPTAIQPFIFDCAVNHGPRRAVRFVQTVCNEAGCQPPLAVDGDLGPKTAAAAEWAETTFGPAFLNALLTERRNFYRRIVVRQPSQDVFLVGWMNRLNAFAPVTA
ncbi:MAG: glycosyl hydrolase 108 family protein [Desulfosarcinaceae bacterium]|nr:glycosyl hydrolase 108 family protein [Desulfosarcinaceae bacterium]